jgi:hypothetical protein
MDHAVGPCRSGSGRDLAVVEIGVSRRVERDLHPLHRLGGLTRSWERERYFRQGHCLRLVVGDTQAEHDLELLARCLRSDRQIECLALLDWLHIDHQIRRTHRLTSVMNLSVAYTDFHLRLKSELLSSSYQRIDFKDSDRTRRNPGAHCSMEEKEVSVLRLHASSRFERLPENLRIPVDRRRCLLPVGRSAAVNHKLSLPVFQGAIF